MHVIGTAGHVDHGKTALVKALTGMNPDRLKEEQEREMSIDLGFAWATLPDGKEIGFVDVPGHRDFIENMLAGIGGIDAALLVVAADEGVMPQTLEHVSILDLLDVSRGVVALTKMDVVREPGWSELVTEEIGSLLASTSLAGAPIVPVSAKRGDGIDDLTEELMSLLERTPERRDIGRPRLGVDRSFSMTGFGTIATGTLVDGNLVVGQEILVLPAGIQARIRGLQTHQAALEKAIPGSRVAVNLAGIEAEAIRRGDVVTLSDMDEPTTRLDVQVRVLKGAPGDLVHDQEAKLFLGAAQRMARVRILGTSNRLRPGELGYLQLLLAEPIVARFGDHYILRRPSPPATLAGGRVVDPHPVRKHRKGDTSVIDRLKTKLEGTSGERMLQVFDSEGPLALAEVIARLAISTAEAKGLADELIRLDRLVVLPAQEPLYVSATRWEALRHEVDTILRKFHESHPLRQGLSQEELRTKLRLSPKAFSAIIEKLSAAEDVQDLGNLVAAGQFEVSLESDQLEAVTKLLAEFSISSTAPPTVAEAKARVGAELYHHLLHRGELVQVSDEIVFSRKAFEDMSRRIVELISVGGDKTVAQIRDQLGSTRKYVLPLLEYLDQKGLTVREGDARRLA
jgi:selenocysteine-specific elongation factor